MRKDNKIFRVIFFACFMVMVMLALSGKKADATSTEIAESLHLVDSLHHAYMRSDLLPLVDSTANVITDSLEILAPFMEKLASLQQGGNNRVSILHIGDSHIQAGFMTSRLRELFQSDFGDAGRGMIVPQRMANMNEPRDYSITTPYGYKSRKATDRGIEERLGFTGVAVTFETPYNELKIWSKSPFNDITVFHAPNAPMLYEPDALSIGSYCTIDNTPNSTRIMLSQKVDSLTLSGFVSPNYNDPTFYGFSLENGEPGVIYHSIGLNGAAFEHFVNNTSIATGGAAALCPDIIIISLGTNNCYGNNFRHAQMYNAVDVFVRKIKEEYPDVPLLMTTPMESCQRKTVRGKRTYVANHNIVTGVEIVCDVAVDNEVAYWNLYAAGGGSKAMESWYPKGLAQTDRIHLTEEGYIFQADMFYDAFARYYNQYINRE